jgi:hypothetical protein
VLDESDVPLTPTSQADVREPISSSCTANPFNADGAACQGGAIGTPFFLFTNGTSPRGLFAGAYQPGTTVTGGASGITTSGATVTGTVNPQGASVNVSFQYGTTTAYGQSTPAQKTGPDDAADTFSAALAGLPAGTTIHYRALASSDFGTFAGADQTLTTASPPPPPPPPPPGPGHASAGHAKVSGKTAAVRVACTGGTCHLRLSLTVTEKLRHHRLIVVGVARSVNLTLSAGQVRTVRLTLNGTGRHLLASRHTLKARLAVVQTDGHTRTVSQQTVTFKRRR